MPWLGGGRRLWPRAKYTATFAGLFTRALSLILLLVPREADSAALSMGSRHLFQQKTKRRLDRETLARLEKGEAKLHCAGLASG